MNCTKHVIAGGLFALAITGISQAAVIKMIGDGIATGAVGSESFIKRLTVDYHMVAANEYHLDGIIIVNPGVTLTVDPGTVIRGYNEVDTLSNRPGTLIIDRGAKAYMTGTAALPIIMTTRYDNNVPGQTAGVVNQTWKYRSSGTTTVTITQDYDYSKLGDLHGYWGGLVLCGKAFASYNGDVNTPALGDAKIPVEGIGSVANCFGGGHDDNDSSGVYTYIQIRYGGYPLADGSEINGMTFYSVGRGTEVNHIEVFNNQDDCFEWFGGTVNAKNLVAWGPGDDTFDSDCGFRGKNQFLFGVQRNMGGGKYESGVADKGLEMDGTESVCVASPATTGLQEPYSASAWYNITLVGWNGDMKGKYYRNGAIIMRDNCAAQVRNSVFMNFGGFGTLVENKTGVGDYYSRWHFETNNLSVFLPSSTATNVYGYTIDKQYLYQAQEPGTQAAIRDNVFWACGNVTCPTGANLTDGGGTDPLFGGDGSKGPVFSKGDNLDITAAGYDNIDVYLAADLPIQSFATTPYNRTNSWGTGALANTALANTQKGDSITNINPLAAHAAVTAARPVRGDEFLSPVTYRGAFDETNNWAQGWTLTAKLGVFGAYVPASDETAGTVYVTNTVTSVVTNGVNGIVYQDTSTALSGTSVTAASIHTSPVVTYSITAAGTYQLQTTASLDTPVWTVVKTFTVAAASAGSPVTINLTDITGDLLTNSSDSRFYKLIQQ